MVRASVIIPVYNAGTYLRECLDSILGQTVEQIEVICVDDGSTDDSRAILAEYAAADGRVTVLEQSNGGAGKARNRGLEIARGDYLFFLDADDFFDRTMVASACDTCDADRADVGVFRAQYYSVKTCRFTHAEALLRTRLLPETMPFSRKDIPEHILDFISPAPWNKVFKREFVAEQGLRFQEICRTNDFLFTKLALVTAERITFIDEVLANYRIGMDSNIQATNHETPFVFYEALAALRDELKRRGLYDEVKRSYANTVLSLCLYNLHSLKTPESFDAVYNRLRDEYFRDLGLDEFGPDDFFAEHQYEQFRAIEDLPAEAYLLQELAFVRAQREHDRNRLHDLSARLSKAEGRLNRIQGASWYRAARGIASIPRALKRFFAGGPRKAG